MMIFKHILHEIGINRPEITPLSVNNLTISLLDDVKYDIWLLDHPDKKISSIYTNHGWKIGNQSLIFLKNLDQKKLISMFVELKKIENSINNNDNI